MSDVVRHIRRGDCNHKEAQELQLVILKLENLKGQR